MKHLKRFNEELKSSTYLRAAHKLRKFGNESSIKRADALKDWAQKTEIKEYYTKWEEQVKLLSKFGMIKGILNGEQIDFYYELTFDDLNFEDTFEDAKSTDPDNFEATIPLMLWLAPTTKEGVEKCLESVPSDYFGNGQFQAFYLSIDFSVDNDVLKLTNFNLYKEEEVNISLTSNAASKVLNMIARIFSDKSLNYPSSSTEYTNEYDHLNGTICAENGLSSDYGFELEQVAEYVKTVPKQKLM